MTVTPEIMCLGCVPIVDNERTNAYVKWACEQGLMSPRCFTSVNLNTCPADSPLVPYTNPADDLVCWFDPDVPESAEFLGLWIVGMSGLEDDLYSRSTSDIGGDGSAFNRPQRPGKILTFDVMLLAASCCGMDFGRAWLTNVLRGQGCAHGLTRFSDLCGTTELKLRQCCPNEGDVDTGLRTFPIAALTEGLRRADGDRRDNCCCNYQRYTFVMTAATADSFGEFEIVCDGEELDEENIQCRDWENGCVEVAAVNPCGDPTACGDLFIDAFESPSLRDDCFCNPIEVVRTCCCVDEFQSGATTRSIIIDLMAGSDATNPIVAKRGARNTEILIFENPKKLPCPTTQEEFDYFRNNQPICARVTVGYIASGSTLRIDGRTGEAYVLCAGQKLPVYDGVDGDLKHLETGCNPLIVCALWDNSTAVYPPETDAVKPHKMTVSVARKFA